MQITPNLGLYSWESGDDPYTHDQLAANANVLDVHDHTPGHGKPITTAAIVDNAITTVKIADGAIGTNKYAPGSIPSSAFQPGSVDSTALKDQGVNTSELADGSVTSVKLAHDVIFLGQVVFFWRPNISVPIPTGYEVADGRTLTSGQHDFPGGGNLNLPDLRNRFVLGAATGGTGSDPASPPAIGQIGSSNQGNLAHSHVVDAHSHVVNAHSHVVNAHNHIVNDHRHTVDPHSHVVTSHTHTITPHTHLVPAHTHFMDHQHLVFPHSHPIGNDGTHAHTFAGGYQVRQRPYEPSATADSRRQALYAAGYNMGSTDTAADMDPAGSHDHGGSTGQQGTGTTTASTAQTGAWSGSTQGNSSISSGAASPSTTTASPMTDYQAPNTSLETPGTSNASPGTSSVSPGTSVGLSSVDVRPAYIGLLALIKVRY